MKRLLLLLEIRARKWPIIADGGGVWSFIHLEDAAAATVLALEYNGPAIYNIVDDEPATTAVWLTELAKIFGAKPPQRYPRLWRPPTASQPLAASLPAPI